MACRSREELVGKRFLSVKSDGKLKVGKMSEWEWRPGFVRAVSTRDTSSADFTVSMTLSRFKFRPKDTLLNVFHLGSAEYNKNQIKHELLGRYTLSRPT